ncbi:efflux RND transporter periplasmic adaptor subunit [Cellvibrio fontiphilus]|uniref:Efflux RND transporter periplasmic adaptor subunit n=1 Tax=Cellvibrio fontiphilus TaxID=1815559 RepID=A0ABV7FEP2_9GAMM
MDIRLEPQKPRLRKHHWLLVLAALVVIFSGYYLWYLGQADISVDANSLVFDEVKRGNFTFSVRGTGLLVPDNIEWLSASVEGTVVKRAVKPGHAVKKGDVIVELSNPRLVQQLAEAQWELAALEAELSAADVVLASSLQQQKSNLLNARLDVETSELEFSARAELMKTGAVSRLDYNRTRLVLDQAQQRMQTHQHQLDKMEESFTAQRNAHSARLNQHKQRVAIIQQQVNDLQITATMDSVVLELPPVSGQRVMMGDNIAKLAQQDSLIAELKIPELHIREVMPGQTVIVDTRNNKISGQVARVDPAVINGTVQVDVVFNEPLPDDARPDLSVDGEIKITEIADTLYVARPLFTQSRSETLLYKLTEDGHFFERVAVQLGQGSANHIQILKGLAAGDKVIISDPTRFRSYDKLRLN